MVEQLTLVKNWRHPIRNMAAFRAVALKVGLLLGLAGTVWGGNALLIPPAAVAYTSRVNLFLVREQDESFASLVRRAEITARAGVQRSFDADLLVSAAIVTIVGESQGITVPLLTVDVTRRQWRDLPDIAYWAKYYETADSLMGL
jgi:hypothetical protein